MGAGAAETGAMAATGGAAMASTIGGMQTFANLASMSRTFVASPDANVSTDVATDLNALRDEMCWTTASCPLPWAKASKQKQEAERECELKFGRDHAAFDDCMWELRGDDVFNYWHDEVWKGEVEFDTVIMWLGLLMLLTYVVHVPAVAWAHVKIRRGTMKRTDATVTPKIAAERRTSNCRLEFDARPRSWR